MPFRKGRANCCRRSCSPGASHKTVRPKKTEIVCHFSDNAGLSHATSVFRCIASTAGAALFCAYDFAFYSDVYIPVVDTRRAGQLLDTDFKSSRAKLIEGGARLFDRHKP
jgi:hypothetical protein